MTPSFNSPMAALNQYVPNWNGAATNFMDSVKTGGISTTLNTPQFQPNWRQNAFGFTDSNGIKTDGWAGTALGAASALGGAFMGMKQYGVAKQQLAESKRQFDVNYGAQRQLINTEMEDRQRARVASNPSAYQSVGTYMNDNKVR